MRPPAEQLIRDYLNRLSVAARNRLQPEDRRAFLVRTNDFIERQSGVRGTADPAEVMRILANIGDPEAVVERERVRLETQRSERAAAASRVVLWKPRRPDAGPGPGSGSGPGSGPGPGSGEDGEAKPPALTNKDGRPLTGEIKVTSRPITSRWRPGEPLKPPRPTRADRPGRAGRGGGANPIPSPRSDGSAPEGGTAPAASGPQAGAANPPAPSAPGAVAPPGPKSGTPAGPGGPAVAGGPVSGGAGGPVSAGAGGPAGAGAGGPAVAGPAGSAVAGPGGSVPAGTRNGAPAGSNGTGPVSRLPSAPAASPGTPGSAGTRAQRVLPQAAPPDVGPLAPNAGGGAAASASPGRGVRIGPRHTLRIGRIARPARTRRLRQGLQPGDVTRDIARRAADVGRRHRLEAISVVLMIIAGLIYPFPIWFVGFVIWLVGAALVIMSDLWSLPDKWASVAGPILLVIIGTAVAISLGGKLATIHDYVHEALANARYLIQIGALLGGGFLAWRLQRGRRPPAVPPWLRRNSRG
jgi:hypothetical protein